MFDPHEEYLEPPLQGHRLVGEGYERIAPHADGSLESRELGLRLDIEDGQLRFVRLQSSTLRAPRRPQEIPRSGTDQT